MPRKMRPGDRADWNRHELVRLHRPLRTPELGQFRLGGGALLFGGLQFVGIAAGEDGRAAAGQGMRAAAGQGMWERNAGPVTLQSSVDCNPRFHKPVAL